MRVAQTAVSRSIIGAFDVTKRSYLETSEHPNLVPSNLWIMKVAP